MAFEVYNMEVWQMEDAITTVVDANGFAVWRLHFADGCFDLELTEHLTDDAASMLAGQFPIAADYCGEGNHGSVFALSI